MLDRIAAFTGIPVSEEVLEAVAVKMLGKPEAKTRDSSNCYNGILFDRASGGAPAQQVAQQAGEGAGGDLAVRTLQVVTLQMVTLQCGQVLSRLGYPKLVGPAQE